MTMIDASTYISRFTGVTTQFDLAMRALDGFKGSEEAVAKYLAEELQLLRSTIGDALEERNLEREKHWAFSDDSKKKILEAMKGSLTSKLDEVVNRIRQNKLILMVTVMESFLKDVHRAILVENPSLLRSDRQIPLGKLVALSGQAVIAEEIEREVQSLDRQSVKQRAEYFDKRLNISWYDGTIIPLVEPVLEMRNRILHQDPDAQVTEKNLKLAQVVCMALPIGCVMQAAVLYPKAFRWGDTKLDGIRALMEKQGRLKPSTEIPAAK